MTRQLRSDLEGERSLHGRVDCDFTTEELAHDQLSLFGKGQPAERTVFISCSFIDLGAFSERSAVRPDLISASLLRRWARGRADL